MKNKPLWVRVRWILFLILTIAWMGVIFAFSAKNANTSTQQSRYMGRLIGRIFVPHFGDWPESDQYAFAEKWDYPVRKAAHMSEYALLGCLMMGTLMYTRTKYYWRTAGVSLIACAIYATTDEVHQYFVPGRACKVMDVGIDSAGALVGILLMTGILYLWNKRLNPKGEGIV